MAYQFITYEKRDRVAWVAINRPEVMNAVHLPTDKELFQVWQDFDADPELRVAILSGAGERGFCAGSDLKYEAELTGRGENSSHLAFGGFGGLTDPRFKARKPIIAAVHGYALGGGFELALACDLIIAADQAQFGLPEPRVGVVAGASGMHRLPRQIPLKTAMGMLLTGKYLSAQDAYRLGLVN